MIKYDQTALYSTKSDTERRSMAPEKKPETGCNAIVNRIEKEILPLFEKAILDETVYFYNSHLVKCWEEKSCENKQCPVSGDNLRCWQVAGTYCGGKVQGMFVDKYKNCKLCEVYQKACPTIVEQLGEGLNNLLFLLRKEKNISKRNFEKISHLNKELLSSLENLDARNREIQELVITDKLTGLYNRHYMMTTLDDELLRCDRIQRDLAVLMMDVDNFKSFNDSYGHINGDTVLARLGELIKKSVRQYDRAFRYGGEEFVIILPETDQTIAWMVGERIRERFSKEKFYIKQEDGEPLIVSRTLSAGVVSYRKGLTAGQILMQADEAMYMAKSQGKNQVVRFGYQPPPE